MEVCIWNLKGKKENSMIIELYIVLFAVVYLMGTSIIHGLKVIGYNKSNKIAESDQPKIEEYMNQWSDRELEEKLKGEVKIPSKYNEIWERIEKYKEDGGYWSIHCGRYAASAWESVGEKRLPLFNNKYKIPKGTDLMFNYRTIVMLLMHTHDKQLGAEAYMAIRKQLGYPNNRFGNFVPYEYASTFEADLYRKINYYSD